MSKDYILPSISTKQLTDLSDSLLNEVLTSVESLKPSPEDVIALTLAVNTLAYVGLSLPFADETTTSVLKTRAALAKSSIEDVAASELQKTADAAEKLWTKVVGVIEGFASQAITLGLTALVSAV